MIRLGVIGFLIDVLMIRLGEIGETLMISSESVNDKVR